MAWSKVDDRLFAHPKVLAAGVAAMGLWVMAQSYSSCYGTDGNVPMATVALLCSNSGLPHGTEPLLLADKLVEVGLWERTEQGYQFHDWGQYNPTRTRQASEKTGVRLSRSEAGKLGAAKRWANRESDTNSKNGKTDGKEPMANAIRQNGPVPVPVPTPEPEKMEEKGANDLPLDPPPPPPNQTPPSTATPPDHWSLRDTLTSRAGKDFDAFVTGAGERAFVAFVAHRHQQGADLADDFSVLGDWIASGETFEKLTPPKSLQATLGKPAADGTRDGSGLATAIATAHRWRKQKLSSASRRPPATQKRVVATPEEIRAITGGINPFAGVVRG